MRMKPFTTKKHVFVVNVLKWLSSLMCSSLGTLEKCSKESGIKNSSSSNRDMSVLCTRAASSNTKEFKDRFSLRCHEKKVCAAFVSKNVSVAV